MSGGVDSSVAAFLLLEAGYDVHGLFMNNWEDDEDGYCQAAQDYQDARQVCAELGIPLHKVDFAEEYRERVFAYFLEEIAAGRTPNPDVLCNREIKFGTFREYASRLGARYIATGHYVRVERSASGISLLKGMDRSKDQSYFLNAVPASALQDALFPIGEMQKTEVRSIAREQGFDNFGKKDSTGICFIGERHFRSFLHFLEEIAAGRTPNPDVLCNREIKFGTFREYASRLGGKAGAVFRLAADPVTVDRSQHVRAGFSMKRADADNWCSPGHPDDRSDIPCRRLLASNVLQTNLSWFLRRQVSDGKLYGIALTGAKCSVTCGERQYLIDDAAAQAPFTIINHRELAGRHRPLVVIEAQ